MTAEASSSDIKKAYYKRARELHPDKNRGDPAAHSNFQAAITLALPLPLTLPLTLTLTLPLTRFAKQLLQPEPEADGGDGATDRARGAVSRRRLSMSSAAPPPKGSISFTVSWPPSHPHP